MTREFFVIGTGRCGSTLLSELLNLHPEVLSASELLFALGPQRVFSSKVHDAHELWASMSHVDDDLRDVLATAPPPELRIDAGAVDLAETSPLMLVSLPHLSCDPSGLLREIGAEVLGYPPAQFAAHLDRLLDWLRRRHGRNVWVERSGASAEYVDQLLPRWPEAGYVCLLRDGRDCAYSMYRHPLFRMRVSRLVARNPRLDVRTCLSMELPVDRFGAYWSSLMLHMSRALRRDVERVHLMHYEDLVASPAEQLERLRRFMALGASTAWSEHPERFIRVGERSWRSLPAADQARLDRACRPGMNALQTLARAPI
jgi:putative sulfotransferase